MSAAIVTAAGALCAAIVAWLLSRAKDRETVWRSTKLKHYEEFVAALSGTVSAQAGTVDKMRWAHACNAIHLIASPRVLECLYAFQDVTKASVEKLDLVQHDATLTALLSAIRADLGLAAADGFPNSKARLWSAPKSE